MLIVKKFHDYYDSAIGFDGVDKTCVYDRTPKQITDKYEFVELHNRFKSIEQKRDTGPLFVEYYSINSRKKLIKSAEPNLVKPFIVGFCGKTYVGYRFIWENENYREEKSQIVYGPDAFFDLRKFDIKGSAKYSSDKRWYEKTKTYFEHFHNKEHSELFFKYKVPVWIFDFGCGIDNNLDTKTFSHITSQFIINPQLKNYEFYQMFDAASTFQEIQMYLQGVLGATEKPIVEISNDDKIAQHGFDSKWSFRNPCPPKRKTGKCKI